MEKTNIGIIGCGIISKIYAKNLSQRFEGARLAAFADLDTDKARARAEEFPGTRVLEVDALLAEDGPEAPDTVIEVRSAERNIRGEHELITGPHRRHSSFVLPADTYLVRVKSGQAEAEREVVMEAGERTDSSVVMRAGTLHAQARQADGTPVSADVRWSVFAICDETHEEEEVVAFSRSNEFVLPHGTYVVQAHVGEQEFQKEVEIGSGEDIQMEIEIGEM